MRRRVIRLAGAPRPALFHLDLPSESIRQACGVRFRQSEPESHHNMEKTSNKTKTSSFVEKDEMSSLGDAYATRSDEEGYGGIYGRNQNLGQCEEEDNEGVQDNQKGTKGQNQDYDRTQGSEVKEKEKGRHSKEQGSHISDGK